MSEINDKYKQIMEDIENSIKDQQTLDLVKNKISELSLLFIDMLDRVTRLTDTKIQNIENKQKEIIERVNLVQNSVENIENDIYEDDENFEFEIVCPYCNYEFIADIEDENKDEIQCPECHNTIELDWNLDEDISTCSGECSHCNSACNTEEDKSNDSNTKKKMELNKEKQENDEQDEDDM